MQKKIIAIFFTTLFLLSSGALTGQCAHKKNIVIKFGTLAPEGTIWMKHMRLLEKKLKKKSKGKVRFKMYPGGVLGDETGILRKIMNGQIHCAAFSGEGLSKILPSVRILDLPFLFRNDQEVDKVLSELQGYYSSQFRKKQFEFLSWAEVGNVHLFSKKPINKLSDIAHLKIWTSTGDPVSKATFSAMGNNPIPLAVTDVNTALSTGMIDTVYAPILGALSYQWQMSVKYMTTIPITHSTSAVLISSRFFKKIPESMAVLIADEFKNEMAELSKDLRNQSESAMKLVEKSGLVILPIPAGNDLEDFHNVHEKVVGILTKKNPKDYPRTILNKIYKLLGR